MNWVVKFMYIFDFFCFDIVRDVRNISVERIVINVKSFFVFIISIIILKRNFIMKCVIIVWKGFIVFCF